MSFICTNRFGISLTNSKNAGRIGVLGLKLYAFFEEAKSFLVFIRLEKVDYFWRNWIIHRSGTQISRRKSMTIQFEQKMRHISLNDLLHAFFEGEINDVTGTSVRMFKTIIESLEQIQIISYLSLASFLIGSDNHILPLLNTRNFRTESLKRKRNTVHATLHQVLSPFFQIINDRADILKIRQLGTKLFDYLELLFCRINPLDHFSSSLFSSFTSNR